MLSSAFRHRTIGKGFDSAGAGRPNRSTASSRAESIRRTSHPMFSQANANSLVVSTLKNWLLGFWKTLPTHAAVSVIGTTLGSMPPTETSPHRSPSQKWGMRPFTSLVTVVLPHPERPQSTTTCPAGTSMHTSSRASRPSSAPLCRKETCLMLTGTPAAVRFGAITLSPPSPSPLRRGRPSAPPSQRLPTRTRRRNGWCASPAHRDRG